MSASGYIAWSIEPNEIRQNIRVKMCWKAILNRALCLSTLPKGIAVISQFPRRLGRMSFLKLHRKHSFFSFLSFSPFLFLFLIRLSRLGIWTLTFSHIALMYIKATSCSRSQSEFLSPLLIAMSPQIRQEDFSFYPSSISFSLSRAVDPDATDDSDDRDDRNDKDDRTKEVSP